MGIFVDIEALSERQSNMALGMIYKAIHEDHESGIWAEHPSPFVRRLVELFTQRGLMRIDAFRAELAAWLRGERHTHGGVTMPRPVDAMERWRPEELGIVRLYLETLLPDAWTLDDHMLLVDWLVQRYLPARDLRSEAEWLAVRGTLMGRVQANFERLTEHQADVVLAALPATAEQAAEMFSMPLRQRQVLEFARARCAENVRQVSDSTRHRLRVQVAQHVEQVQMGGKQAALETKLFDTFSELNRDWRRIAVTEAGEAQGQGYIASLKPGTKVRRLEQYKGRCGWCASIDGRVFTVVDPAAPDKDGATMVWVGKNNVGRSAAPRKRVGDVLVEREPHEMYWVACGTQHPHCRGRWLPVHEDQPGDDPEFGAWLRQLLEKKR